MMTRTKLIVSLAVIESGCPQPVAQAGVCGGREIR